MAVPLSLPKSLQPQTQKGPLSGFEPLFRFCGREEKDTGGWGVGSELPFARLSAWHWVFAPPLAIGGFPPPATITPGRLSVFVPWIPPLWLCDMLVTW